MNTEKKTAKAFAADAIGCGKGNEKAITQFSIGAAVGAWVGSVRFSVDIPSFNNCWKDGLLVEIPTEFRIEVFPRTSRLFYVVS